MKLNLLSLLFISSVAFAQSPKPAPSLADTMDSIGAAMILQDMDTLKSQGHGQFAK